MKKLITVDTLYAIAERRLKEVFPEVSFNSNEIKAVRIATILTCDAMIKAGVSISIRWLSYEAQHERLNGIEELMFDLALEDKEMVEWYRKLVLHNSKAYGNGYRLDNAPFKHTSHLVYGRGL